MAVSIFSLILLQTDLPYEQRLAWYGAGVLGLVLSYGLFWWMRKRQ